LLLAIQLILVSAKEFNVKMIASIKSLTVIGIVLLICFKTLQFFNKKDALNGGENFLKIHKLEVESIDCDVPVLSLSFIDRPTSFCTFRATSKQI
jgi:hypothetical protein